jgi:hypothetical protein
MGHKNAERHPKSSWDGWKNARRALNSGERKSKRKNKSKSARFLGKLLVMVAATQCSRSRPHRMCQ